MLTVWPCGWAVMNGGVWMSVTTSVATRLVIEPLLLDTIAE